MRKFISTLLILSTLSCFTTVVGSFAKDTTASDLSIGYAFDLAKSKTGEAIDEIKYGLGKALNWTKSTAAWNAAAYGLDLAWYNAKFEAGKVYEWIIKMWCEYVGLGCQNSIGPNNQGISKNVTEAKAEL